ncbi:MAG: hypothetical protein FJ280_22535 [Planctomycetes bacterium]|nr:hypothetical protein [Planctomycetota bacterium]
MNLTIVGGRPSQKESARKDTPRGLEVLLKKASVDEEFRELLLAQRSEAVKEICLELDPAEGMMLDTLPGAQLEAIIRRTRVPAEDRRIFLGKVASVMLAALGAGVTACSGCRGSRADHPPTTGIRPDRVERPTSANAPARAEAGAPDPNQAPGTTPQASEANDVNTPGQEPRAFSAGIRVDFPRKPPAE